MRSHLEWRSYCKNDIFQNRIIENEFEEVREKLAYMKILVEDFGAILLQASQDLLSQFKKRYEELLASKVLPDDEDTWRGDKRWFSYEMS